VVAQAECRGVSLATSSLALGLSVAIRPVIADDLQVTETNVTVKTPDGLCDAAFFHPTNGSHPGVLIWHDSLGLRPAMRVLGRRIAAAGYAVLVPNLFYRVAKAPVFDASFDYANNPADRETYGRIVAPFLAPGSAERDAVAYISFLDGQPQADRRRKIGTHGYCLGGPYVLKTAAAMPDRVGAGASFHGGFLVTGKPDSPHLLAPKIKDQLRPVFDAAKLPAEIETHPNAGHGWSVPDSKTANKDAADHVWTKLVALYQSAL
jgi:carboxymethylenebutenolidase